MVDMMTSPVTSRKVPEAEIEDFDMNEQFVDGAKKDLKDDTTLGVPVTDEMDGE
jgi:hypothetical protein